MEPMEMKRKQAMALLADLGGEETIIKKMSGRDIYPDLDWDTGYFLLSGKEMFYLLDTDEDGNARLYVLCKDDLSMDSEESIDFIMQALFYLQDSFKEEEEKEEEEEEEEEEGDYEDLRDLRDYDFKKEDILKVFLLLKENL